MKVPEYIIREAQESDCAEIHRLICEHAVYEKMPEQMTLTLEQLREDGFGKGHPPRFFSFVVEKVGSAELVGFTVFNDFYSSWKARTCWVTELYLVESCRGSGVGFQLFKKIVERAAHLKFGRIEWNVLAQNIPAIKFYKKLNAVDMYEADDYHMYRLTSDKFESLLQA